MVEVISGITQIIEDGHGLITQEGLQSSGATGAGALPQRHRDLHLAPGALWRRAETKPSKIVLGDVIGAGAFSKVHKGTFLQKTVAVKIFRNTTDEKAFREIEITFSLRHPNIIGLYAWFQIPGALKQTGMVVEFAGRGDLRKLYGNQDKYSFKVGLKIMLGVAKGLAYMHSMPSPIVHRDIKSMNVMVMDDGETGKLGDCGESRRVDLDATMTLTGSPLWAAVGYAFAYEDDAMREEQRC